ncbi:hypothetical protein GPJ56_008464 [Histomonas meleagridis]|uniref:uncharacterized protein n=1 Tax=Histomonas meleagridis TaxID=135588 RepID=UPI0035595E71|nr:hypothetical protein GPJ56_008464 [Histomonas meleagridis]KAH0797658.1 hypothetical protein GO595_009287 [Histomonas meleagridis]
MEEDAQEITYTVKEGEPAEIKFGNEGLEASFAIAKIDKVDPKNPTTLKAEFLVYPSEDDQEKGATPDLEQMELAKFDDPSKLEVDILFLTSDEMKSKFIVEGPGVVTVQGLVAPEGTFVLDDEEEEEEEANENKK